MMEMADSDLHDYINFEYYLQNIGSAKTSSSSYATEDTERTRYQNDTDSAEYPEHSMTTSGGDGLYNVTCDEYKENNMANVNDFSPEQEENDYGADWNSAGPSLDTVDYSPGLSAIAEERSPDLVPEVQEQSWCNHRGEHSGLRPEAIFSENPSQWTSDTMHEQHWRSECVGTVLPNSAYEEELAPNSDRNHYSFVSKVDEHLSSLDIPADGTSEADMGQFARNAAEIFSCVESDPFPIDKLVAAERNAEVHEQYQTRDEPTVSVYDTHPKTQTEPVYVNYIGNSSEISRNWKDAEPCGSYPGEKFDEEIEDADGKEETMNDIAVEEMEDKIEDRCGWNSDLTLEEVSQEVSWIQCNGETAGKYSLIHIEPESSNRELEHLQSNELHMRKQMFNNSEYRECDQSLDCRSNDDNQDPVQVDPDAVFHEEDHYRSHQIRSKYCYDAGQALTQKQADDDTSPVTSPDSAVAQPASVEDTLPRRGHMRNLLAQWREFEQRRKDEELIDRTAAISSERSRRTAVRRAWFKAPDSKPDREFAASRSQSCGPIGKRQAKVSVSEDIHSSSGNMDDEDEAPASFDRTAIKQMFERLESEAQRTSIVSRKKHFKWNVKEASSLSRPVGLRATS